METDKQGGGAMAFIVAAIVIMIFAAIIFISFKCSKLVYSYSRSALLSVWTFLVLVFLFMTLLSLFTAAESLTSAQIELATLVLVGFWVAGVGSIFFSTHTLYKKKKSEVDELIKEENYVERQTYISKRQISKNSANTAKLLTGAGALYAGYTLGKKTGL